ncbi:MAG: glycosyl transferase [Lachnospiraceae bacterium]|nr:glycosyl transferase [Lachnospiraceae bacterium]
MNSPIDIIVPWVDGTDLKWQKEKSEYMEKRLVDSKANSAIRYQDWNNLQYWFRAVEKFMPWVHRIFFVTWGHVPEFLDTSNPKLRIVKHQEYIPDKYLPTFNSNTIEMNYHRIKDLSENFVLFNDDVIPLKPVGETYYFKNNRVCEQAVESPIMPVDIGDISHWSCIMKSNNILFINRHFNKRDVQKKNFWKWFYPGYGELLKRNIGLHYWYNFAGFHDPHMAVALKKSTLAHLWEVEPDTLDAASRNRFRGQSDVNQFLIRYWQLCTGEFLPRKTLGKSVLITKNNYREIAENIRRQKWQMVSLNEDCSPEEFEIIKKEINGALEQLLPDKSTFEL